jgi:hypothetical protein
MIFNSQIYKPSGAAWHGSDLGTGKSPKPADKNVGATWRGLGKQRWRLLALGGRAELAGCQPAIQQTASLRYSSHSYSMASRIIAETFKAGLVRHATPENKSRKYAQYLPFWLM